MAAAYACTVQVEAPVRTVWDVTREVESWPRWSQTMGTVVSQQAGPVDVGSRVRVRQPGLRPAT